ncbi:hypothetical protein MG5_01146 [Candida albicans P57072]|uniref:Carboxymuconolactone decarboxylase-like domain-containing protein n=5 Tax=Candida TaxID=5475 RepID=Q5A3J2_CANAL|eukprot:XP_716347.1 hypothetical protein CAALFM_C111890WA [Candida albicans SC5314]
MTLLTAERLVRLAYKYPSLSNTWYLIATACLTVINQPDEIPKLYHFALRQQLLQDPKSSSSSTSLLTDKHLIQLAKDSIDSAKKYQDLTAVGINLPDVLIPSTYYQDLPLDFKFSKNEDIFHFQDKLTARFREVILKSIALVGLPKVINSLMVLKTVTPTNLKAGNIPERPCIVNPGHIPSASILSEDVNGTRFDDTKENLVSVDTIDGPISQSSINTKQIQSDLIRGSNFWNSVYRNKINTRIKNQMFTAYPDLWYFAYHHVYSPLLSFTDIISAKETSMCVVACLIPQDVNPQLKGHLKGALNNGGTKEELNDVRSLVFDLCDWKGGITWKGGKEGVAKL